eukprot:4096118-Prymnesium_polylepis.1
MERFSERHGGSFICVGPSSPENESPQTRRRSASHIDKQNTIMMGLRKPVELRNDVDVTQLMLATSAVKFFKAMGRETHRALVKELTVCLLYTSPSPRDAHES